MNLEPISVGKTQAGNFEFGEFYHVAAYLAAGGSRDIEVIGEQTKCVHHIDFLKRFASADVLVSFKDMTSSGAKSPGETANYFKLVASKNKEIEMQVSYKIQEVVSAEKRGMTAQQLKDFEGYLHPFKKFKKSCFVWIRKGVHEPYRDMTESSYHQLIKLVQDCGFKPIVIGPQTEFCSKDQKNLIEFYEEPLFANNPLMQLVFLNDLCERAGVRFSIGMMSGGMDGIGFLRRLKTIYFARSQDNGRMKKVATAFPAYSWVRIRYSTHFVSHGDNELRKACEVINS